MARSESITASTDEYHFEYVERSDHAELVVQRDGVTITVEGDPEEVHRQFEHHYAEAVDATPEELAGAVEEHPMPDLDELEARRSLLWRRVPVIDSRQKLRRWAQTAISKRPKFH